MRCTGCRFKSNSMFSAGNYVWCAYDHATHPREHGCSHGEKRTRAKGKIGDNPIMFTE